MRKQSHHHTAMFSSSDTKWSIKCLHLLILIVVGLRVECRPTERVSRSAEEILAGVDFLSILMDSAEQPFTNQITTTVHPVQTTESPLYSYLGVTTTRNPRDNQAPNNLHSTDTIPVTILTNTNLNTDDMIAADSKLILTVSTPKSEKSFFSVKENDPYSFVVVDSNEDTKSKRKTEDLVASGANPDYLAQQNARIHGVASYQPYNPSRGRSTSYNTEAQKDFKSWYVEDENNGNKRMNKPVFNAYTSSSDYDYTESYPNYILDFKNDTTAKFGTEPAVDNKEYFSHNTPRFSHNQIGIQGNWNLLEKNYNIPESDHKPAVYGRPEENYEVDEAISLRTNGRAHGIVGNKNDEKPLAMKEQGADEIHDNQKIGYVVEGRDYRKYRVEERTSDGFIVGEYGVVRNNDGNLRGVRYTADGTINPGLIYNALMKFLSL